MRRTLRLLIFAGLLTPEAWCACHGPAQIVSAGIEDHFQGPPKPVTPSARLAADPSAKVYSRLYGNTRFRSFDEDGPNRLFLTSLLLPARKICSAQFEMRVRRRPGEK